MHLIRSLIICSLLISLSIYAPYKAFFDQVPQNKNLVINIERGDTIYEVFSLFLPINFANKLFLKIYSLRNDINLIQYGEYQIGNKSILDIINLIKSGETITHKLKINEGLNIYDIENLINDSYLINDCSFLKCINTNHHLERAFFILILIFIKKV